MVSLNNGPMMAKTLPNKYIYNITGKLIPTNYQSVLATEFVIFSSLWMMSNSLFFVCSYRIEDEASGKTSVNAFQVHTTAVYTVLLHTTSDAKVGEIEFKLKVLINN